MSRVHAASRELVTARARKDEQTQLHEQELRRLNEQNKKLEKYVTVVLDQ